MDRGANINAKTECVGKKPIHKAAAGGHINVIKFFLNKDISINDADNCGSTPLHEAASFGKLETVKFLVENGANVYAKRTDGNKPIHHAAEDGYKNIVEIFLDKEINIDDAGKHGWTPLHYAAKYGKLAVVKLLIDRKANMHAQNIFGEKPIHLAAAGGRKDVVEFLLNKRTNVNDATKDGWTPLHYAIDRDELEVVKLLIDRRADVHAETKDGKKPIDLARGRNYFDHVKDRNRSSIAELLRKKMEEVEKEESRRKERKLQEKREREEESCVIQSTHSNKKQQEAFLRGISDTDMRRVKQGLYLPSFEKREVKVDGKCVAITGSLSQALFLQNDKSLLNNLKTSSAIYERIVQGKQISKREEREVFAFSKLLNNFERQLDSATNSLPSNLIHTQGYKTFSGLSNYIAGVKGNFAIHLVTNNHVVAVYRIGDNYAYFDSNAAFVSGLKSVDQLIGVVEKGVKSAGYKVEEKGFLVEHFDVTKANNLLSGEDRQVLTREIKTERQLLAEQDKELGPLRSMVDRVQLYDFGTKINVKGGVPLLINAGMNLSSKKFQDHLDKKEVSMTAREYLDNLKNSKNVEEVVQATKEIPFEGSKREIEEAEQTRKPKQFLLEQSVKGAMNFIAGKLTADFFASVSQPEPEKVPETHLNDLTVDKQQKRSQGY